MDRLERLVNLVAALIDTPQPLTRQQIHERIEGYSDDPDAFRRNFERDKELLRQMGLPLATEPLDPSHPDEVGYRIPREEYELPDPGLDEDELTALRLAAAAVQLDGAWGRDASVRALRKLAGAATAETGPATGETGPATGETGTAGQPGPAGGTGTPGPPGAAGLAALPGGDLIAIAFEAIAAHRRVRFTYRQEDRVVDPWRLSYRRGQWYLAGLDHTRGEERLFRLDRIVGALRAEGPPGAFARPAPGAAGPRPPWRFGDEEETRAELLVDADQVQWAVDALGADAISSRRPDGSVVFEVGVTDVGAFRSFVLGFLDHAEILGPPDLRHDLVEWLARLAQPAPASPIASSPGPTASPVASSPDLTASPPSPSSPRPGRG